MKTLRAAVRLFRLANESLLLWLVFTIGRALLLPAPQRVRRTWRRFMYRLWARRVATLFAIEATFSGELPAGEFVLAANHLSYVDVPLLAQRVEVAFIAKREVRSWPLVGMLAASVGTIFVNRESRRDALRVTTEMKRALAEGRAVALFPEGTATDGTQVLPFKPALLEVAAREQLPVVSAAIAYSTDDPAAPASTHVCWAGDDAFATHAWRLLHLDRVRASVHFGPMRRSDDRKVLAQQLRDDIIAALYGSSARGQKSDRESGDRSD